MTKLLWVNSFYSSEVIDNICNAPFLRHYTNHFIHFFHLFLTCVLEKRNVEWTRTKCKTKVYYKLQSSKLIFVCTIGGKNHITKIQKQYNTWNFDLYVGFSTTLYSNENFCFEKKKLKKNVHAWRERCKAMHIKNQ